MVGVVWAKGLLEVGVDQLQHHRGKQEHGDQVGHGHEAVEGIAAGIFKRICVLYSTLGRKASPNAAKSRKKAAFLSPRALLCRVCTNRGEIVWGGVILVIVGNLR